MKLLHVIASPRQRSRSRRLADGFIEALQPDSVTELDVWKADLPDLGGETVEGRYRLIHGQPVASEVEQRWAEIREVADQAMAHDLWLISTPMWNFSLPYRLKHWIDCIVHPGMTFTNDASGAVTTLATGRRAVVVGAGALDFADETQRATLDHQMSYLATILGFIGVDPVHMVRAAPTFGPEEAVEQAMRQAAVELDALARRISSADAPG